MTKVLRLVIAAAVLGSVFYVGSPSQAGVCGGKKVCLFVDSNFEGLMKEIVGRPRVINLKAEQEDQLSSIENGRAKIVILYSERNAKGKSFCVPGNTDDDFLAAFNDVTSSLKLSRKTNCPL